MQWYAPASGKRGRQQTFTDAAVQFVEHQVPVWLGTAPEPGTDSEPAASGGAESAGSRFQHHPSPSEDAAGAASLPAQRHRALDLLIDITGIDSYGEGEWKRKKHGAEYRRQWRKVHLGIDAHTLEIRAIEVTDNSVGDAPMLPELLAQIPLDEPVASVGGDGAYDTKGCHAAIAQRGAQAVIPPRKNARPWRQTLEGAGGRNEALRACQRLGRRIWKKWSGYHRRSLVETKMHCFKRLGERVMARTLSARSQNCMCGWLCSTASHNLGARQRCLCLLWRSSVVGVGVVSARFWFVQQSPRRFFGARAV